MLLLHLEASFKLRFCYWPLPLYYLCFYNTLPCTSLILTLTNPDTSPWFSGLASGFLHSYAPAVLLLDWDWLAGSELCWKNKQTERQKITLHLAPAVGFVSIEVMWKWSLTARDNILGWPKLLNCSVFYTLSCWVLACTPFLQFLHLPFTAVATQCQQKQAGSWAKQNFPAFKEMTC